MRRTVKKLSEFQKEHNIGVFRLGKKQTNFGHGRQDVLVHPWCHIAALWLLFYKARSWFPMFIFRQWKFISCNRIMSKEDWICGVWSWHNFTCRTHALARCCPRCTWITSYSVTSKNLYSLFEMTACKKILRFFLEISFHLTAVNTMKAMRKW